MQTCGNVPLGGRSEAILRLQAPSSRDTTARVTVNNALRLSLPGAGKDGVQVVSVPSGASTDVIVGCRGGQLGAFAAEVQVELVEEARTHVIPVDGRVEGSSLQLYPRTIDFGDVAVFPGRPAKARARRSLVLRNEGNAPLQFDAEKPFRVENLDGTTSEAFSIVAEPAARSPAEPENTLRLDLEFHGGSTGEKQALLYIRSNDPRSPSRAVRIQANAVELPPCALEITPASIDFGRLGPGEVAKRWVAVRNLGTAEDARCLISGVRVTGANAFFTTAPESGELAPGEEREIEVGAVSHGSPAAEGRAVTGALELLVSDPDAPQRTIPLTAELAQSCIELSSPGLYLNAYGAACAVRESLTLRNVCSEPVLLKHIEEVEAPVSLVQAPAVPSAGLTIAPGDRTVIGLRYAPDVIGLHHTAIPIELELNGITSTWHIPLHGRASEGPMQTDTFETARTLDADVLFVIDNGPELEPLMASVRSNLAAFAKYARSGYPDARIAVTTTAGTGTVGRAELVPTSTGETVLAADDSEFEATFNQLIAGIPLAPSNHDVLATAVDATRDPQLQLRALAPLSVIVITPARDRSPATVESYQWQLEQAKPGRRTLVSFHAIGPLWSWSGRSCTAEVDDGRLYRLVQVTSGMKEDICVPDWEKSLERLGPAYFGWRSWFVLSRLIDPMRGETRVRMNGIEIPAVDERGATPWVVAPEVNAIVFEPIYVPEPGMITEVTYPVACWE